MTCRTSQRRGITLIEAVVSLVLLATLVSGMVVAYSAHHRQALLASRRRLAQQAADELLSQWYSSSDPQVPRNGGGILPAQMAWRTRVVHQNMIESLPVEVVRLELFTTSTSSSQQNSNKQDSDGSHTAKPLTQVDVILPIPQNELSDG